MQVLKKKYIYIYNLIINLLKFTFSKIILNGIVVIDNKSIHLGGVINLVIWYHKKLFYLFYILTLQNTQYQWFYFNFQYNKIV